MARAQAMARTGLLASLPYLSEAEQDRFNNLNLIRFVLASAVVLSHCYVILGRFDDEPMQRYLGFNDLGGTAVMSFFFLSGYLIFKSALRSTPAQFVAARMLRIFPALIVVTLLCFSVLGPIVTNLTLGEYFTDAGSWRYLGTAALMLGDMSLPGVFGGASVNQPLWTLPSEWLMYMCMLAICIAVAGARDEGLRRSGWVMVGFLMVLTALMMPLPWDATLRWMAFAILGAGAYIARRFVPLSMSLMLVLLAVDVIALLTVPIVGKAIFPFALGYALLVIGFHPTLHQQWFHKLGDYSYGIYIFAWPFQRLFAPSAESPEMLFVYSYPAALLVAFLSWHFVEGPSLHLKNILVGARARAGATAPLPISSQDKVSI